MRLATFGRALRRSEQPTAPDCPAAPSAAIADQITAANAELASLEAEYDRLAYGKVTGDEAAARAFPDAQAALAAQRDRVEALHAAHRVALATEQQAGQEAAMATRDAQVAATRQHLAERDKAAQRLSTVLNDTVQAFHDVLRANAAAQMAVPPGFEIGPGDMLAIGAVKDAIAFEMDRLCRIEAPSDLGAVKYLPGCRPASLTASPLDQSTLIQRFADATSYILKRLGGP